MTTRLKEHNCPACNHLLNAATSLAADNATPEAEDITLCISCGEILQFDEQLDLTKIEDEVLGTFPAETLCLILGTQQQIRKRITH